MFIPDGDAIASEVLRQYEILECGGKPRVGEERSVLAGIVLQDENDGVLRTVSLGTGTKCLGRSSLTPDGSRLHDSHAEVIARRGLIRALIAQLSLSDKSHPDSFLQKSFTATLPAKWRVGGLLHMYISETPCGDASIYKRTVKQVNGLNGNGLRFTGASLPDHATEEDEQELGVMRLKSGRNDLPPENRTLSMSCSDKLVRWMLCGLQGNNSGILLPQGCLLGIRFEGPIRLASITISLDPEALSAEVVKIALHRAMGRRVVQYQGIRDVNSREEELNPSIHLPHIQFTMLQFPCCRGYKAHDVSINWAKIPAALCPDMFVRFSSKRRRKNWHWGAEVTVGRTGRLQGCTKNKTCCSKERLLHMRLPHEAEATYTARKMIGCSRLCRKVLASSLAEVESYNSRGMIPNNPTLMEKEPGPISITTTPTYKDYKARDFEGSWVRNVFMESAVPAGWCCTESILDCTPLQEFPVKSG